MEPEGSLPHSQAPDNSPHSKQDRFNSCLPILLTEDPFQYCLLNYAYVFRMVSLPQVSPTKTPLSPIRTTCPVHLILLDLITHIFGEDYKS